MRPTQFEHSFSLATLAENEIIYPKNVGASVAMNFTYITVTESADSGFIPLL
jgi:hypothetical protein